MRIAAAIGIGLLLLVCATAQNDLRSLSDEEHQQYSEWVKSYRDTPMTPALAANYQQSDIWFQVWSVECESLKATPHTLTPKPCPLPLNMCQVSYTGVRMCMHTTCCPGVGGGGGPMRRDKFDQLKDLVPDLPDDSARLPDPGYRLVVRVGHGSMRQVRVYDERHLPNPVKRLVGLIGLPMPAVETQR